jgi:hypothetical protein
MKLGSPPLLKSVPTSNCKGVEVATVSTPSFKSVASLQPALKRFRQKLVLRLQLADRRHSGLAACFTPAMCTPLNDAPGWKEQPTKAQGVATARQKPRLLNPIFSCRCAPHRFEPSLRRSCPALASRGSARKSASPPDLGVSRRGN